MGLTKVLPILVVALAGAANCQLTSQSPTDAEHVHIKILRHSGLTRDMSKVDLLVSELKNPRHKHAQYAAVRSLGQLGAPQGLDALAELITTTRSQPDLGNFAKVCRARLVAGVAAATSIDPQQRAQIRFHRFLGELGIDASKLTLIATQQLDAYRKTRHPVIGTELYALRELADMVYLDRDSSLLAIIRTSDVKFDADWASDLKVRLAGFTNDQRIHWLIEELSKSTALRDEDTYTIQLTVDLGTPASRAAASKLANMREFNRNQFMYTGFAALFRVIAGVGDHTQEAFIRSFKDDPDKRVSYYSQQVYNSIKAGIPGQFRPAY